MKNKKQNTLTKIQGIFGEELFSSLGLYDMTTIGINSRTCLRSVAGLVIQATERTEFEDGLRTGVLLGHCWCPCGGHTYSRINFKPLWGCRLVLGWVWLLERPHFRPNLLGSAHWWY